MNSRLLSLTLLIALAGAARAQYNPVPITPGSFTQDIVVEKGAPPPLENFANCSIDNGTNATENTFFEQGFVPSRPYTGLPPHGTTFVSHSDSLHTFKMPPTYATNNAAFVGAAKIYNTSTFVTQCVNSAFTVVSPARYQALSILWASAGGQGFVNVTVHYQDGGTYTMPITTIDWFDGSVNYAYTAQGRIRLNGGLNNMRNANVTKLFSTDLTIDPTKTVTSVSFAYDGSGPSTDYRFFAFALSGATDGFTFNPIDVSGFNADPVVEASANYRANYIQGNNVTMDGGAWADGNTFYEQGFCTVVGETNVNRGGQGSTGTTGLPHPGEMISSGNYNFQMPSTYAGNDCVFIGNYPVGTVTNGSYSNPDYTTGSFTITSPKAYSGFSVLDSAANGPVVINYTIYYNDGNSDSGQINALDWFANDATKVFTASGRVTVDGPGIDNLNNAGCGVLFHADLAVSHPSSVATNITFSYASGGRAAIFALSGSTDGSTFNPVNVTGYNADIIVEKEQPFFPAGIFTATSATMDLGTNNCNYTWFEKGWITNGIAAGSGLPPAGSTISSLQSSSRVYQMPASYAANNAVLIDVSHQVANITPVTQQSYSALALLTAGASIGSGNIMTNLCIVQHADGVNETNLFYGYDWFDTGVPAAFIANGRADTRTGGADSIAGPGATQQPRIFETFFQLTDPSSPVTNIVVQYKTANGGNWTTYVLAVSATSGAVPPFVGQATFAPSSPMFEGSNVVVAASVGGSQPIASQWQTSTDGTNWHNVVDGGNITGSTTTNLTITKASWSNGGQYQLVASNSAGSATNVPVSVVIYSALTDVIAPLDPVVVYQPNGGSSPTGGDVFRATDSTVGSGNSYINAGVNSAAPFSGPVGFIVTPEAGKTTVAAARLYTTDGNQPEDPVNWTLEGSNDGNTWTRITTNAFTLPAGRNSSGAAAANPLTQNVLELHFANSVGYISYRVAFWNTANDSVATDVRIGEVELLGTNSYAAPVIIDQPADATVWQGAKPTFTVVATGAPLPLTYQWSRGNSPITGATGPSYTLASAQASDNGATFSCAVTDPQGTTRTRTATLHVITGAPTTSYPTTVMKDSPLALFRLDEADNADGNQGAIAHDYFGGFTGSYSNTVLGAAGFNPILDADTAAQFGSYWQTNSYVSIDGINFAKPAGDTTAAFSVEAWVLNDPNIGPQITDAGIVTKGYGGGGEQFDLDCGNSPAGASRLFRFMVRDSDGTPHRALASVGSTNMNGPFPQTATATLYSWHHVVGVCDFPNSNVLIYVDGILSGTNDTPGLTNGILASSAPVSIGSRQSGLRSEYDAQFIGTIDDVALYNYALTPSQVLAHYYSAQPLPVFNSQPTNTSASSGGPLTVYAGVYGPSLTCQWYQSTDQYTWTPVSGQTSSNLTFTSTAANVGPYFQLVAKNPYGSTTSEVATVTVYQGAPQIVTDLVGTNYVGVGSTVTLQVQAYGTASLTYQWFVSTDKVNFTTLTDSSRISGSQTDTLVISNVLASDTAYYKVHVSNGSGSVDSTTTLLNILGSPTFTDNGQNWGLNGTPTAPAIADNSLPLAYGVGSTARSAFWQAPQPISSFTASWTYQDVNGGGADGYTFCLQNDSRGTAALGGAGGSLGVSGITPSAALEFNIYGTAGMSFGFNGNKGTMSPTTPVNVAGGNPINTVVTYDGAVFQVTLTDTVTSDTYTTNINVGSLTAQLGKDTAYVGFTGADGGISSRQNVSNFVFSVNTSTSTTLSIAVSGSTIMVSWPANAGGILQTAPSLSDPINWQNVADAPTVVNGQNQVVLPVGTGSAFYRLH